MMTAAESSPVQSAAALIRGSARTVRPDLCVVVVAGTRQQQGAAAS
jgi:hypothetical protein